MQLGRKHLASVHADDSGSFETVLFFKNAVDESRLLAFPQMFLAVEQRQVEPRETRRGFLEVSKEEKERMSRNQGSQKESGAAPMESTENRDRAAPRESDCAQHS